MDFNAPHVSLPLNLLSLGYNDQFNYVSGCRIKLPPHDILIYDSYRMDCSIGLANAERIQIKVMYDCICRHNQKVAMHGMHDAQIIRARYLASMPM